MWYCKKDYRVLKTVILMAAMDQLGLMLGDQL